MSAIVLGLLVPGRMKMKPVHLLEISVINHPQRLHLYGIHGAQQRGLLVNAFAKVSDKSLSVIVLHGFPCFHLDAKNQNNWIPQKQDLTGVGKCPN